MNEKQRGSQTLFVAIIYNEFETCTGFHTALANMWKLWKKLYSIQFEAVEQLVMISQLPFRSSISVQVKQCFQRSNFIGLHSPRTTHTFVSCIFFFKKIVLLICTLVNVALSGAQQQQQQHKIITSKKRRQTCADDQKGQKPAILKRGAVGIRLALRIGRLETKSAENQQENARRNCSQNQNEAKAFRHG